MSALDDAMAAYAATAKPSELDAAMREYSTKRQPFVKPPAPAPQNDPGMLSVIGNGLVKGAAGFGDMVGNALVNTANLGIAGYGTIRGLAGGKADTMPDLIPSDALSGYAKIADATGLTSPSREPVTTPQKVADFAAQVVGGGGVNPRSVVRAVSQGKIINPLVQVATPVIGGTVGGVTQQVVNNNVDPDTWYGRTASAVLPAVGQMAGSYPTARISPAGTRAAQTTANVTQAQWEAAQALGAKAAALGSPISATEALQAVTGSNPGLQSLQRVTEQSGPGVNKLAPAFAQRPAQNTNLFNNVADGIFPNETDPGAIAGTLQNAATGSIKAARDFGNSQAGPFYAASSNDPSVMVPPQTWATLTADPAVSWALDQTKRSPLLGVQGAQPGSLQWLDAAKKFLDSHATSQSQAGNNFPASQASKASAAITSAVDPVSPLYAAARNIVADNMQNNVAPMQAGQIGKLAGTNDFVGQAKALLPEQPMDVTPGVVANTATTIGAQDPTIIPRFAAQYLRGTFNEANQDLQNGANQFGGAKFAAKVAGNDTQQQNLSQLLQSSGTNPQGLLDAIDVWRAQGTRPATGSATTFNNGETGLLSGGWLSAAGSPLKIPGLLAEKAAYSTSTKDLANALYPDAGSVGRFQDLARAGVSTSPLTGIQVGNSPMQTAAFSSLLKTANAPNTPQPLSYADYLNDFNAAPDDATRAAVMQKYASVLSSLPASAAASQ